ncbi:hypothetical protein DFJ77DRAFT_175870 [Powellomyces hirtus]|nr:hypothetical protein DFJ77DRAFT_175870 [Powellomyces hirtus]
MGDSDSDAEAYSGSMLFTWDELYTASYVASLCVMVVLIAVFADGILEVTNKSSIRGFWMSIGAMTIKLITGCFFKASQSRVHQITVEFIWAVMSSVDRWAICHMVYVRTTAALIQTTMRRKILGEFLVFGVFVFSFLDFGCEKD